MKYPRIAAQLYSHPWGIMQEKWGDIRDRFEEARAAAMRGAADDKVGPVTRDFWTGEPRMAHPQIEVLGPVALARVDGITGRGLSPLAMQCGGFDTELFIKQLANVEEDGSIKALAIDFNTPGGLVAGNARAVAAINAVRGSGKKVYGYAQKLCASCGYWMAAACDEFHADPDAVVGSISTIVSGVDSSEAWKKEGLERKVFATGIYKAIGMDGKPWTKEEEELIWARIKPHDEEFKGFVKERRGLTDADMQGQWWFAEHAPKGVVDSVAFESLDALLEAVFESL